MDTTKQLLAQLWGFNKKQRRLAAIKLGLEGSDEAIRALILSVASHEQEIITRGKAALMLGKLRDIRAVDALIEALGAPGFQTPIYAAKALGEIGDPRAIEPLLNALFASTSDIFQKAARDALGRLGYNELIPEKV